MTETTRPADDAEELLAEGSALVASNQLFEAKRVLERARQLAPGDAKVSSLLAAVLLRLGEYEEAYALYRDLTERFPSEGSLWLNLGLAADALGRDAEAVEYLERAVRVDPDNHKAHAHLGHLYAKLGDRVAARREFMLAGRLVPEGPELPSNFVYHRADLELTSSPANQLQVRDNRLVARFQEVFYVRRNMVRATSATSAAEPIPRRAAGQDLSGIVEDEGLGEMTQVAGPGGVVAVADSGRLELLSIHDGSVFARQGSLVAFSQGLAWENTALTTADGRLPVIKLSGSGSAVLLVRGGLVRVHLSEDETWRTEPALLVAWSGVLQPTETPESPWAHVSGPGWVLLET